MFLEGTHILLFEDNLDNIELLVSILEDAGATTSLWMGGSRPDFVELLPLDLIILDLMFPGQQTGFDFFEEIRLWPEVENTPIIAVSAMDTSIAVPRARKLGFSGFISKPVDMDLFPQQVRSIIDGGEIWNWHQT